MASKKEALRLKRHKRISLRMRGDSLMPRLMVHRSLKNLYGQLIDDTSNKVLFALSTLNKEIKQKKISGGNIKGVTAFGEIFAGMAKEKGFSKIIFDRAGYLYHGKIKAFAEALRKGGLQF
jgi:large subunit ribosomal protein L18